MEKGKAYIDFGNFLLEIQKIAAIPLWKPVKLKDLNLSRGATQRAYREMKEMDFEGTIVDYICWVELVFFVTIAVDEEKRDDSYQLIKKQRFMPILRLVIKDISYLKKAINTFLEDTEDKELWLSMLSSAVLKAANEHLKITELS